MSDEKILNGKPTLLKKGLEQFLPEGRSLGDLPTELVDELQGLQFTEGEIISERFEMIEQLGFGGMGAVYKVKDLLMRGQLKALKVMLPSLVRSNEARERFISEAEIAQSLRHEGIATVYDIGRHRDILFLTMELLEGQSLDRFLKSKGGRLEFLEAVDIVLRICEGLSYAHKKGVIHRDIKPQNIFILPDGRVKLLDFGLAKLLSPGRLTRSSMGLGTAYYMSPEQSMGKEVDERSDVFSVGVVFYQMLVGRVPMGRFKLPSILNTSIPSPVDSIVEKCLDEQPEERYLKAESLVADIERIRSAYEKEEKGRIEREQKALAEARQDEEKKRNERERKKEIEAKIRAMELIDKGRASQSAGRYREAIDYYRKAEMESGDVSVNSLIEAVKRKLEEEEDRKRQEAAEGRLVEEGKRKLEELKYQEGERLRREAEESKRRREKEEKRRRAKLKTVSIASALMLTILILVYLGLRFTGYIGYETPNKGDKYLVENIEIGLTPGQDTGYYLLKIRKTETEKSPRDSSFRIIILGHNQPLNKLKKGAENMNGRIIEIQGEYIDSYKGKDDGIRRFVYTLDRIKVDGLGGSQVLTNTVPSSPAPIPVKEVIESKPRGFLVDDNPYYVGGKDAKGNLSYTVYFKGKPKKIVYGGMTKTVFRAEYEIDESITIIITNVDENNKMKIEREKHEWIGFSDTAALGGSTKQKIVYKKEKTDGEEKLVPVRVVYWDEISGEMNGFQFQELPKEIVDKESVLVPPSAQKKPEPLEKSEEAAPAPAKPIEVKMEKFSGIVERVKLAEGYLLVKGMVRGKEDEKIFDVDKKTTITRGGKDLPLNDLREGMATSVEYKWDGTKMKAVAIRVAAPKAAPKKEAPERPSEAPKK